MTERVTDRYREVQTDMQTYIRQNRQKDSQTDKHTHEIGGGIHTMKLKNSKKHADTYFAERHTDSKIQAIRKDRQTNIARKL